MHAVEHENHYVYLYASSLFTRSPLLKRIYCESHRCEPWAIHGRETPYGHYMFPQVLYVDRSSRDALLAAIPELLMEDPGYVSCLRQRYDGCLRRVLRLQRDAARATDLVFETARFLSIGVFKESFEPPQAQAFLARFMPVAELEDAILALYQPRALPHFLKYELKRHFFAARGDVAGFIEHAAHHARFLLEKGPLHEPAAARGALQELLDQHGGPDGVAARRRVLLSQHQEVLDGARQAEHRVLQTMYRYARYSLRSRQSVQQALALIAFMASGEELKHIVTVQSARSLRRVLETRRLPIDTTDVEDLESSR